MTNLLNPEDFKKYLNDNSHIAKLQPTSDFADAVRELFYNPQLMAGDQMKFEYLRNKLGFRAGEVTIWAGFNGHGKSMLLGQVMMQMIELYARKVCFASMEMKPETTIQRIARQYLGDQTPKKDELDEFLTLIDEHCWFFNVQGVADAKELIAAMNYAARDVGINHFVIDSLMKCGLGEDDFNGQKAFVDRLCTVARDTGLHIHLVCHSRKGKDELTPPGKMDIRGSGTITDQADNVITVWRNKDPNRPQGEDGLMMIDKQRNGEWEGMMPLRFCQTSHSYYQSYQSL